MHQEVRSVIMSAGHCHFSHVLQLLLSSTHLRILKQPWRDLAGWFYRNGRPRS